MTAMEIRAALLSKGILLIDIAKKCNASKSMVSNVVAGRRKSERIGKGMEIWEVKASRKNIIFEKGCGHCSRIRKVDRQEEPRIGHILN